MRDAFEDMQRDPEDRLRDAPAEEDNWDVPAPDQISEEWHASGIRGEDLDLESLVDLLNDDE